MSMRILLGALAVALVGSGSAAAEPMRLGDPTPRWVVVQFEDSPSEHPERLDRVYTRPFAAWLEADGQGRIVVRVDAEVLEKSLFRGNDPVPGSFSDYVWVFDPETGEVLSASFSGVFAHDVGWGFASSEIHARVRARMQTGRAGGFRGPEPVWGQRLHVWCPEVDREGCRPVESIRYDAARGYVNAVGYLAIDSAIVQLLTYSAVGEARFSEVPSGLRVTPPVASGPADALVAAPSLGGPLSRATTDPASEAAPEAARAP